MRLSHHTKSTLDDIMNQMQGPHALSAELLSEIFLIATHSMREKDKKDSLKKSGPVEADNTVFPEPLLNKEPCTLARVCKYWRRVALSTPFLWSHIRVRVGYGPKRTPLSVKRVEAHFRMVSTWLRLSGTVPLMLCLDTYNGWLLPEEIPHNMDRLNVLHVIQPAPAIGNWMLPPGVYALVADATSIERLHIYHRKPIHFIIRAASFETLSHLKHLCHPRFPMSSSNTQNYSQSLESLEGAWDVKDCLNNIALFPGLQALRVSLHIGLSSPFLFFHQETISRLKILELEDNDSLALKPFLDYLILPAIRVAVFKIPASQYRFVRRGGFYLTLSSFLQRTFSTLAELHLLETSIDEMDAVELLKHSPLLQHLTISVHTLTDAGLLALKLKDDLLDADICPRLVVLRLQSMFNTRISANQVFSTIHSRLAKKPKLKAYFELRYESYQEDAINLESNLSIQELMEQSVLSLSLHYPNRLRKNSFRCYRHYYRR